MRFCFHGDSRCGQNVVNDNMSGGLKGKLMKTDVSCGEMWRLTCACILCIWFLYAAFGSNSRFVSLSLYRRYFTLCSLWLFFVKFSFCHFFEGIVQPKMTVFSLSASFTYSHVVTISYDISSEDCKEDFSKNVHPSHIHFFHLIDVNGKRCLAGFKI